MRPDMELFEAWRGGDPQAGNELFQRHFESVRRFFANKADREVEDLVQRTFVGCVEGQARFEGRSSFRTYLFAVAHNILREFLRAKRRDERLEFGSCSLADLGAGVSSIVAQRREQRALLDALRSIPIDSQVVLELYYWERLTGPELGEVLGVNENTARSRVRRAKELLRSAMDSADPTPPRDPCAAADLDRWAASVRALMP